MNSVLINAATLPIYHDILSHLLTDAVTHGTSMGYDTQILHENTESYFHNLKLTLNKGSKGRMLPWIARAERSVIGTMQLTLCPKPNGPNHVKV